MGVCIQIFPSYDDDSRLNVQLIVLTSANTAYIPWFTFHQPQTINYRQYKLIGLMDLEVRKSNAKMPSCMLCTACYIITWWKSKWTCSRERQEIGPNSFFLKSGTHSHNNYPLPTIIVSIHSWQQSSKFPWLTIVTMTCILQGRFTSEQLHCEVTGVGNLNECTLKSGRHR